MSIQFRWSTTDRAMGAPAAVPTPGRRVLPATDPWADLFTAAPAPISDRVTVSTSGRVVAAKPGVTETAPTPRPRKRKAGDLIMTPEPEVDPNALEGVDFVEWLLEH